MEKRRFMKDNKGYTLIGDDYRYSDYCNNDWRGYGNNHDFA